MPVYTSQSLKLPVQTLERDVLREPASYSKSFELLLFRFVLLIIWGLLMFLLFRGMLHILLLGGCYIFVLFGRGCWAES